ncbi:MAG: folate-binding protein [Gammaproteobacteria bacterium]|nr:folate-binding protein [Gammaproteobacteria bacterium]
MSSTHFAILKFTGEKTQAFLQGQLTCDMNLLTEHGKSSLAALCDHRGRMLANFWVVNFHNDFLLILSSSLATLVSDHLKKYAVFSKISISSADDFSILESEDDIKIIEKTISLPNHKKRIEKGIVILCDKTSLLFTPQMINLEKLGGVSFTKGCYVGQEIVARTQHLGKLKRHLHRMTIQSDHLLNPGDEIENGIIVEAMKTAEANYDVLAVMQDQTT